VCVVIREDSAFCDTLAGISPFQITCKPRFVTTSHGIIILLILLVHDPEQVYTLYEVFFNPFRKGGMNLLSRWSCQTHLKVILFDSDTDTVRRWFEFDNNFGIGQFMDTAQSLAETSPEGDFQLAQQEFMAMHNMSDLLAM